MIGVVLFFGVVWLFAGLAEMNTAITHAKKYGYSQPITYAAWLWLGFAAMAFIAAYLLF
jgi:hypothetical protein